MKTCSKFIATCLLVWVCVSHVSMVAATAKSHTAGTEPSTNDPFLVETDSLEVSSPLSPNRVQDAALKDTAFLSPTGGSTSSDANTYMGLVSGVARGHSIGSEFPYYVPESATRKIVDLLEGDGSSVVNDELTKQLSGYSREDDNSIPIFPSANGAARDCLIEGELPDEIFEGKEYVDAVRELKLKAIKYALSLANDRKDDPKEAVSWPVNDQFTQSDYFRCTEVDLKEKDLCYRMNVFLDTYFQVMVGDGTKPGLIQKNMEDWFAEVAHYAHEHPGVLRAYRKTLRSILSLVQQWMIKHNGYHLTAREKDEILNERAPKKLSGDSRAMCAHHIGGAIGDDPSAVLQVISNGNLREMNTLVMNAMDCVSPNDKQEWCLLDIMKDIAQTIFGLPPSQADYKGPEEYRALLTKHNDSYQRIDKAEKESLYNLVSHKDFKENELLIVDAQKSVEMLNWIQHSGLTINLAMLWDQYRRYQFGDNHWFANPHYPDGDPMLLFHINGRAQVTDAIASNKKKFFYAKGLWAPRKGWVMASRLPGELQIRDKAGLRTMRKRMRENSSVWTWKRMFVDLRVAYLSKREINMMEQCHDKRKYSDMRWALFDPKIKMNEQCIWNSGRHANQMLDRHFPLFSPTKKGTYEEISKNQFGWVDAGPSGTTDEVLLANAFLGGDTNSMWAFRIGLIGALTPYHHHTFLEILQGAAGFGMAYTEDNPSAGLMPLQPDEADAHDCRKLPAVSEHDQGFGANGEAFDIKIASNIIAKIFDSSEAARSWKFGGNMQVLNPAYSLSPEGMKFQMCDIINKEREFMDLRDTFLTCQTIEGAYDAIMEYMCELPKLVANEEGDIVGEVPQEKKQTYHDARQSMCTLVKHFHHNLQVYVPGWDNGVKAGPENTGGTGDYNLGEVLTICSSLDYEKEWSPAVHHELLRGLNAFVNKLKPSGISHGLLHSCEYMTPSKRSRSRLMESLSHAPTDIDLPQMDSSMAPRRMDATDLPQASVIKLKPVRQIPMKRIELGVGGDSSPPMDKSSSVDDATWA